MTPRGKMGKVIKDIFEAEQPQSSMAQQVEVLTKWARGAESLFNNVREQGNSHSGALLDIMASLDSIINILVDADIVDIETHESNKEAFLANVEKRKAEFRAEAEAELKRRQSSIWTPAKKKIIT